MANLNADRVDGKDSIQFAREGAVAVYASRQIRPEGTIRNSVGAVGAVSHSQTGFYCVGFSEPVELARLESTVVGLAGAPFEGQDFPRVANGTGTTKPDRVSVGVPAASVTWMMSSSGSHGFVVP